MVFFFEVLHVFGFTVKLEAHTMFIQNHLVFLLKLNQKQLLMFLRFGNMCRNIGILKKTREAH